MFGRPVWTATSEFLTWSFHAHAYLLFTCFLFCLKIASFCRGIGSAIYPLSSPKMHEGCQYLNPACILFCNITWFCCGVCCTSRLSIAISTHACNEGTGSQHGENATRLHGLVTAGMLLVRYQLLYHIYTHHSTTNSLCLCVSVWMELPLVISRHTAHQSMRLPQDVICVLLPVIGWYRRWAFSVASLITWNWLPRHLCDRVHTTSVFRRLLKTFLFRAENVNSASGAIPALWCCYSFSKCWPIFRIHLLAHFTEEVATK